MKSGFSSKRGRGSTHPEAGGALAFVLIVATALLFVGAYSMHIGLSGRRASVAGLHGASAFFCAETALDRGRTILAAYNEDWNNILAALATDGPYPTWYTGPPMRDVCPGAPGFEYRVTIRDNVDELSGTVNPGADMDQMIIIDAEALQGGVPVAVVTGVVSLTGVILLADYTHQDRQGAQKTGNQ